MFHNYLGFDKTERDDAHLRTKALVEMTKNTILHQISVEKNISSSLFVFQALKQDLLALSHLEHKKGAKCIIIKEVISWRLY